MHERVASGVLTAEGSHSKGGGDGISKVQLFLCRGQPAAEASSLSTLCCLNWIFYFVPGFLIQITRVN